jgi:hypothetical protein
MSPRRYHVTNNPDGSSDIIRTNLGCLGALATFIALFFAAAAIAALIQRSWAAFAILLLLCGICLPNFAKRRRLIQGSKPTVEFPAVVQTGGLLDRPAMHGVAKGVDVLPPPISLADELAKLAALHDQGVLSDEEFDTIKLRLLNHGNSAGR